LTVVKRTTVQVVVTWVTWVTEIICYAKSCMYCTYMYIGVTCTTVTTRCSQGTDDTEYWEFCGFLWNRRRSRCLQGAHSYWAKVNFEPVVPVFGLLIAEGYRVQELFWWTCVCDLCKERARGNFLLPAVAEGWPWSQGLTVK
jgi:hypothetical protein